MQTNKADDCCNVSWEKPDNQTDSKFNVKKPEGVYSFIDDDDDDDLTNNISLLFHLGIAILDLKCEDFLSISLVYFIIESPTNLGSMTCVEQDVGLIFTIP